MRALLALLAIGLVGPAAASAATPAMLTASCATRSEADFPSAFTSPDNWIAGPLSLINGRLAASASPSTIADVDGWKSPAVVRAGHRVTVRIARPARSWVTMTYARRASYGVRFVACRRGFESGSRADGRRVTFWSGFFRMTTRDRGCVPLEVRVDGGPWRRRTFAIASGC